MVIIPKTQASLACFRETKELVKGEKLSFTAINPEDRRVKMVVLELDVIASHSPVVEASCLQKGKSQSRQVMVNLKGGPVDS